MAVFFVVKGAMPVYGCTPCILELKKAFRDLVVRSFCVSRFTVNKKAHYYGIAGSAGRAPPLRAGGLAENRLL